MDFQNIINLIKRQMFYQPSDKLDPIGLTVFFSYIKYTQVNKYDNQSLSTYKRTTYAICRPRIVFFYT